MTLLSIEVKNQVKNCSNFGLWGSYDSLDFKGCHTVRSMDKCNTKNSRIFWDTREVWQLGLQRLFDILK